MEKEKLYPKRDKKICENCGETAKEYLPCSCGVKDCVLNSTCKECKAKEKGMARTNED